MHRCFVNPEDWSESEIRLTAPENHHLLRVIRARAGDRVGIFDGCGREGVAEVVLGEGGEAALGVLSRTEAAPSGTRVVLVQAVPKGKRMDLIVEKAVELGVSSVWPVVTERVVVRLDDRKRMERAARWQRIALSAARQCGAASVPDVVPVSDFVDVLPRCASFDLVLMAAVDAKAEGLRSVLDAARGRNSGRSDLGIALLIGPEGDFTENEIAAAVEAGASLVSLGARVLRTETAAMYGLSVLAYEFPQAALPREAREDRGAAAESGSVS